MIYKIVGIAIAALAMAASTLHGENTDTVMSRRIDALIKSLPESSEVGIYVYDLTEGKALYSYREKKLSRPASTMKLLTAVTAIDLEPDEAFSTEVFYHGTVAADTLHGDLYVVGGFDPEFSSEAMDSLVAQVASLPFSHINGKIYGDVSAKDSIYWGHGWAWDDTPASFQPYMSPLMLQKGTVKVTARPAERSGEPAIVDVYPKSSYYTLDNRTLTKTHSAGEFGVTRNWLNNGNAITVSGNITTTSSAEINLFSSQDYFMTVFCERLKEHGVSTDSLYSFATLPDDSTSICVATYRTHVQDVLNRMLKKSDNLNAEAMLWRAGRHAKSTEVSAADGVSEIEKMIKRAGAHHLQYKIVDGSGLSNYDYLSPELLVDVLKYAYSKSAVFQRIYKALPIAGVDGTLRGRMKSGRAFKNVHAKTGSYTAINALAGYMKRADGHMVAFAIMNQNILVASAARHFQDAVCEAIADGHK